MNVPAKLINLYHLYTRLGWPNCRWWGVPVTHADNAFGPSDLVVHIEPTSSPGVVLGNAVRYSMRELELGDFTEKVRAHCEEARKLYQLLS